MGKKKRIKVLTCAAVAALSLGSVTATAALLLPGVFASGEYPAVSPAPQADVAIMDCFDRMISHTLADSADAAHKVKKHFWLEDDVTVCPTPAQNCYGETDDPKTLSWLLEAASEILDGQDTLFQTDLEIFPNSKVMYYLDETIFAVTWKQIFDNYVYTISEVKIADPSQFRRYFVNGEYNANVYSTTTHMAQAVHAVVASSGDFYRNRSCGAVVYDGELKRANRLDRIDTCFIDQNGDLLFAYRGELADKQAAEKFVDEHDVAFSLSFGPVLVDDGKRCEPASYILGEVNDKYARAALCQQDKLHYLVVTANAQGRCRNDPDIHTFAKNIAAFGCQKAYTLDGGQTGVIAMDGKLINAVLTGKQRPISDIFYFATALPSRESKEN